MNRAQLKTLGEDVRKQGYDAKNSLKDLVYDLETGEFVQCAKGEVVPSSCNIVTEMTREGFAFECENDDGLFKRGAGLIENDALANRRVVIVGLGSFGSVVAVELAKAAVGKFVFVDFDRLEAHNIMRHACYLKDVGRLKTEAVSDLVKGKNPAVEVECLNVDASKAVSSLRTAVASADIVIVATDNNPSRLIVSGLVAKHGKIAIFGRANTRAEGGDVFVQHPGGPCYGCLVGAGAYGHGAEEVSSVASGRRSGQIPDYMSEEDAVSVAQVGLSTDIMPICNLMVKLALVELSHGTNGGLSSLESELKYDYWLWANRREHRFANWASFYKCGHRPCILRWYGVSIAKVGECTVCGSVTAETLEA